MWAIGFLSQAEICFCYLYIKFFSNLKIMEENLMATLLGMGTWTTESKCIMSFSCLSGLVKMSQALGNLL